MKGRRQIGIRLVSIAITIGLLVGVVWLVAAYGFYVLEAGEDVYVVCTNGHVSADFTLPAPRPTPTNSPYPGPGTNYQTSVYIKCTAEEPMILSVQHRTFFPIMHNE